MRKYGRHIAFFSFFYFLFSAITLAQQPGWTFNPFGDEKKPEQYEEKKLASEKTGEKKFNFFRRFVQNNTTRYNYYFNADQKIDAVLARAKESSKDDYSRLLSFYPYSLEGTAAQATELDSVIYKATAGVLLHDLRSDWVDDMYLLIGKAYFLKNELDSAALTFQFINYNLYPRKKDDDGYGRVVGGNNESSNGNISIANKEKQNFLQKTLSLPPTRNDALVWLTRTYIEQKDYGEAAGLINILRQDPNLPKRLQNDIEEINSYWFYAQNNYDSAATHLKNALSNADNKQDKSRWEYLLAQMLEMNGQYDEASKYYALAGKHTVSPVMEIYASLMDAKMMRNSGNVKELDNAIARLLKMARKDRYDGYQDIIFYSAAQLSLQRPDTTNALGMYTKGVTYQLENGGYKNKSYLQMANISYVQRDYRNAARYYDSLTYTPTEIAELEDDFTDRKENLTLVVEKLDIIDREDSLQRIAAMSPLERDALVKRMVRKYRKEQGLKDEDVTLANGAFVLPNSGGIPTQDLFTTDKNGDWYFYNSGQRSRGFNEFKQKWGKRENVDNWRRKAAGLGAMAQTPGGGFGDPNDPNPGVKLNGAVDSTNKELAYTFEGLMGKLPLSKESVDISNDLIATSLLELALIFQNSLQDYVQAAITYEEYLKRFGSNRPDASQAYLGLYFCYGKLGNNQKANEYKNTLANKYAGSKEATMVQNPGLLQPDRKNEVVTKRYADIYNMFVEGNFSEAISAKKSADSVYGTNYWSPQLLYIESVYQIKQRDDSAAITALQNIQTLYPESPLREKAATMVDVLRRRSEIEAYLTELEVTRVEEDKLIVVNDRQKPVEQAKAVPTPPVVTKVITNDIPVIKQDTLTAVTPKMKSGSFQLDPYVKHKVIMVLNKVDPVYVNEAKNAIGRYNNESFYTRSLVIAKDTIDAQQSLLLIGSFDDAPTALTYYEKVKKAAPNEMSWLPANKYSFYIISDANLEILKENKNLSGYKELLNTNYNNIF